MIWFSYTDKLYNKMLGFLKEIYWYHHHQQFLFTIKRKQWKWHVIWSFQLFGPVLFSAPVYGSFTAAGADTTIWRHSNFVHFDHENRGKPWLKTSSKADFQKFSALLTQPKPAQISNSVFMKIGHCLTYMQWLWLQDPIDFMSSFPPILLQCGL